MTLFEFYGYLSGYKLNVEKTQILSINYSPSIETQQRYSFKWDKKYIHYLGIIITKNLSEFYETNNKPLNQEIFKDMDRWEVLMLDFSSRIDIIKMNVLPRILYFFQSLPVPIPPSQFIEW